MSDIREMLVDTATKIMKDVCSKDLVMEAEKGIWPIQLWNVLEETGMTLVGISEDVGGVGVDVGDALSLLRIAGKYTAPIPLAETFIANYLLSSAGLPIISDAATVAPVSKKDILKFTQTTNGWIVNGRAQYIPWARDVKKMALFGKTNGDEIIIASIDLEKCQIIEGVNLAGEPRDEIVFDYVFIPNESALLNPALTEERFWNVSLSTRIALMAGTLERVLELTVEYANERSQFGKQIGKFQAVKQQLAVMAGEVVASSAATDFIVEAIDLGDINPEIEMAKIQLGDAATTVAQISHQIIGAMGFTDEHLLHLSTRRLWSWRDEYGTESEHALNIGEIVLQQNPEFLWEMLTSSKNANIV